MIVVAVVFGVMLVCGGGLAALLLRWSKGELKRLWHSLKRWQVPIKWYVFALTSTGLCALLALGVFWQLSTTRWLLDPWYTFFIMLIIFLPFSPFWEELGWRGFLLPVLQLLEIIGYVNEPPQNWKNQGVRSGFRMKTPIFF